MDSDIERLVNLANELGFDPVNDETLVGDFHGMPAAFTVLSLDPPGFMFQIRLNPVSGITLPEVIENEESSFDTDVVISIHNKCVWVSYYDIQPLETADIRSMLDQLAQSILASRYAQVGICLRCSKRETADLLFVEGRPTRVCDQCLVEAEEEQEHREAKLNESSISAVLTLPFIGVASATLWALFWFSVDLILDYFNIKVLEINYVSMAMILGLFWVIGWAIGSPLGAILRRTPIVRRAPRAMGAMLTVGLVVVGEILYSAGLILWAVGVVDLVLAPLFAVHMLLDSTPFWNLCKLVLALAVGFFCCMSAAKRKTVSLEV